MTMNSGGRWNRSTATWGEPAARTKPSQNIAITITDEIQPAVLETVSGGTNAGSARDRRTGPPYRRRSVQVWVRDSDRIREGPQGAFRRHRPVHFGEEERARVDAGVAA